MSTSRKTPKGIIAPTDAIIGAELQTIGPQPLERAFTGQLPMVEQTEEIRRRNREQRERRAAEIRERQAAALRPELMEARQRRVAELREQHKKSRDDIRRQMESSR